MFVPRAKRHLWEEARELRREGWSLREVARWLDVALSSVSVWTRGVVSSPAPRSPAPSVVVGPEQEEAPRWCSRCASHRPATDFNRFAGGRQWWCRACFKRYYAEGRARHRSRNNALKAQRVMEAQQLVFDHLSGRACVDCGEPDPVVLEFDHVGPKRCEVSTLVRRGVRPAVLRLELERCDIVCASCHRRRTAFRAGWRRLDLDRPRRPWRSKAQERNVRYVVAALAASGCTDCGESDPCVLEHDHVGEKTQGVMQLARREVGLARLAAEMARCEVRCVNCHRRRTSVAGSHFRAQASVPPARVELALRD
jgi:hypothetical protein